MPQEMAQFPSNGGTAPGYLATPGSGSGPGVVVIQEYWGLVTHIQDICDRFAGGGFVATAPDLYHGVKTREPDEADELLMALNTDQAAGIHTDFKIYPGIHHAFFNDSRAPEPDTPYNAQAAQDAWERTLRFFRQYLT